MSQDKMSKGQNVKGKKCKREKMSKGQNVKGKKCQREKTSPLFVSHFLLPHQKILVNYPLFIVAFIDAENLREMTLILLIFHSLSCKMKWMIDWVRVSIVSTICSTDLPVFPSWKTYLRKRFFVEVPHQMRSSVPVADNKRLLRDFGSAGPVNLVKDH